MKASSFVLMINKNSQSNVLLTILVSVSALFLAVLSGILAAFGNLYFLLALLALYGIFFILITPVAWIIWIIFCATFLISGPSAYFFRFTQLQWLTVLVGAALLLSVVLHLLRNKTSILSVRISSDLVWPVIFIVLIFFSTIIDQPQFADFVNASRHYLFMWPLMLVFMFGLVSPETMMRLWKALLIVAVLQLPMAIYQYFFVAAKNARYSPWDAVIGTFHGNIEGGGDSAAMAVMLLIAMLIAIALWREGKLHVGWMALVVVAGLCTLSLAEVKAAVMLLPVVFGLYYRRELVQRPIESVVVIIGALLLVGSIFTAYEKLHYDNISMHTFKSDQVVSTYDRVLRALSPDAETGRGIELGRVNHMNLWWEFNIESGDVHHSLFGYGMGATDASKIGVGELAQRFPYPLQKSSTLVLLWEAGIVGHLAFLLILLQGARTSGRIAKNETIPEIHRIFLRVGETGLLLLAITLLYKNFHFYSIPIQFLMMLLLGQAGYWLRYVKANPER
ncbi:hypothetical protein [Nitrosomonas sp. Nm166]|uniref:hypothetical protein n=1 Tax=Nitrosomonas sp. Nm166 TaxID=1881054 RepID=UPI0008E193B8|nr:hypothetical protein [Nitrosomonas sp. Nm166]SFD95236.1 hypothetical protein SAMN05428977_100363 [Nitrosomonas sp. Nm166]